MGYHESDMFQIQISDQEIEEVHCQDGWTYILKTSQNHTNKLFNQSFTEDPIGDVEQNYFIGLRNSKEMTKAEDYSLRVEIIDDEDNFFFGVYHGFRINDSELFELTYEDFSSSHLMNPWQNGSKFRSPQDENCDIFGW